MRKKTLLLIVVLLVLIIAAVFYFLSQAGSSGFGGAVRNLLPFGNNTGLNGSVGAPIEDPDFTSTSTIVVNSDIDAPAPLFRKISDGPVSGFTSFNRQRTEIRDGKKVIINETPIRFIERATGNIFETLSTSTKTDRLTNTTMPRIQEAYFTNNGSSVILRSLGDTDEIKTYFADINTPVQNASTSAPITIGSLQGFYIKEDVSFVEVSPDTKKVLLVSEDVSGTEIQTIDTRGGGTKTVYTSRLGEWLAQWYGTDSVAITSKPSSGFNGTILSLNLKTNKSDVILSNVPGVTSLVNTTGTRLLFNQAQNQGFAFGTYDVKTGAKYQLAQATLPEKCVWSKKYANTAYCLVPNILSPGTYPDAWYQGTISFTDSIWKIDTDTHTMSVIYDPAKSSSVNIDGIRLGLTPDEDYLIFMNKKDGSLWSLRLSLQ